MRGGLLSKKLQEITHASCHHEGWPLGFTIVGAKLNIPCVLVPNWSGLVQSFSLTFHGPVLGGSVQFFLCHKNTRTGSGSGISNLISKTRTKPDF